ncbi:MAG: hypothetical protein ACMV0I_07015 [Pseudomonas sp.]
MGGSPWRIEKYFNENTVRTFFLLAAGFTSGHVHRRVTRWLEPVMCRADVN